MAKRGWSLTDAQIERRKQNPAARRSTRPDAATTRAKVTARKQAMSRPSNTQQRRKREAADREGATKFDSSTRAGSWGPDQTALNRYVATQSFGASEPPTPNQVDYTVPDMRSLGGSSKIQGHDYPAMEPTREFRTHGASQRPAWPNPDKERVFPSVEKAYRAADASMYNSTVTPKAKRVEDKPSWSRMSPDQNVFW